VYYEVGYADAFGKPLILIARKGVKVHFDLQGLNILFYKGMFHLEGILAKAIDGIRSDAIQADSDQRGAH